MWGIQSKRQVWLACLLLAFATLWVYRPAFHYDFINYDDDNYVYNNKSVTDGLSWQGLAGLLVEEHSCNWHPLTWLSHMLDCQLFGLQAGGHHLMNVLFHCANAVLLLLVLNSLTGRLARSAFVAALFALHPLRVESVAWVSERKDVLSGFFFMWMLWAYVVYAKRQPSMPAAAQLWQARFKSDAAHRHLIFYKVSLACFFLGLLAKPMLVTVPFVLLLIDFWPLRRLESLKLVASGPVTLAGKNAVFNPQLTGLLLEKLPFFLLALLVGIITLIVQGAGSCWVPADAPLISRLANTIIGYSGYLAKLFWPQNLSVLYLRSNHVPLALFILATLIFLGLSILALVNLRRRPWLATGWLWFVIMLLPVSGLLQIGRQSIADRYTYLPAIGFYLAVTWGFVELAGTGFSRKYFRIAVTVGAVAILLGCAALSRQQLAYWQNTRTLMEHALALDPGNEIARIDLNIYLFAKAHPDIRQPPPNSSGSIR